MSAYRLVLVLISFVMLQTICEAGIFPAKRTINILNSVYVGRSKVDITVHCKSGDDDLGQHVLPYGGTYTFQFRPTRSSLFYCSFAWQNQFKRFLAEIVALLLLADDDTSLSLKDINEKVGKEKNGCCWQPFKVYRHLIEISWLHNQVTWCPLDSPKIHEVWLVFDVYLPNSKFKKSSPGDPSFVLCSTGWSFLSCPDLSVHGVLRLLHYTRAELQETCNRAEASEVEDPSIPPSQSVLASCCLSALHCAAKKVIKVLQLRHLLNMEQHHTGDNMVSLMDGHGGSDGLHRYFPSLDHVVADTIENMNYEDFLLKSKDEWITKSTMNVYCNLNAFPDIVKVLRKVGELAAFRRTCFGHLIDIPN
ncbi:hypothetical protein LWI29_023272 [Acer saccharum]|uniref:S-protein homolog n=1 Tax=Acer saccharum TaxID=4024 RepID=A0AA39SW17_ACESA|nr:hypothetical protein LWI29_023272 [Acer saccharum]